MTKIITVACFKGGVGKSTFTELLSYILATKHNKKVLVIDTDPQSNVTEKLKRTFNKNSITPQLSIMDSIRQFDLTSSIIKLHDNLDLVHGDWTLENFSEFTMKEVEEKARYYMFYTLLKPIKHKYDYIIFDTRPSTSETTTNAICTSDYVIITTKTEQDSYTSTKKTYDYMANLTDYNENLNLIGILPYLVNQRGSINKLIEKELRSSFNTDVYNNVIKSSDRVVTWGYTGITEHKPHDKKTMQMYEDTVNETLSRIQQIEKENDYE